MLKLRLEIAKVGHKFYDRFLVLSQGYQCGGNKIETATVEYASLCYTQYLRLCSLTEIIQMGIIIKYIFVKINLCLYAFVRHDTFIVSEVKVFIQSDRRTWLTLIKNIRIFVYFVGSEMLASVAYNTPLPLEQRV